MLVVEETYPRVSGGTEEKITIALLVKNYFTSELFDALLAVKPHELPPLPKGDSSVR